LFVLAGITLDVVFHRLQGVWLKAVLILALLSPGIIPAIRLHPYQYTYYNQFVGGTGKAAKLYETDYWMTCYREAVENLGLVAEDSVNLFVRREFYIAAYYSKENVNVLSFSRKKVQPGDYVLNPSRANPSLQLFPDLVPYILRVERDGAIFCEVRQR